MQVPSMVNESLKILDNKYISAMIGLFLALYAGLAAPKLPKYITIYFDNPMFKLGIMFLIAYMATKDPPVAIIAAVALLVSLQTLSSQKTTDKVVKAVKSKVNTIQSEVDKSKYLKNITEGFGEDSDEEDSDFEPRVEPPVEQTVKQTVEQTGELKQIDEVMKPIIDQVIKIEEVKQAQADAAAQAEAEAAAAAQATAQAEAAAKVAAQAQAVAQAQAQAAAQAQAQADAAAQAQAQAAAQAATQAQAAAQAQVAAQAATQVAEKTAIQAAVQESQVIQKNLNMAQKSNGCSQTVDDSIMGYDLGEYASY